MKHQFEVTVYHFVTTQATVVHMLSLITVPPLTCLDFYLDTVRKNQKHNKSDTIFSQIFNSQRMGSFTTRDGEPSFAPAFRRCT
jgi:hypothetical protein